MSELVKTSMAKASERMEKAVSHSRSEFSKVRTGRASPDLVEKLGVEAYGSEMRIIDLASISVPEARQLLVTPHDPANVEAIEKAIRTSDLGVSPGNDGTSIRLNFPVLTEERRKELVRLVKKMAEEGKVSLRNVRRDARKDLDSAQKSNEISEDDLNRAEKDLDKLTQDSEAAIDTASEAKEKELLDV